VVRLVLAPVFVCVLAGGALAQPAPDQPLPPAPAPAPVTEPAPPPPAPVATDPAWDAYDDAFARAAKGDKDGAKARLAEIAARWPAHPASSRATALAARLAEPPAERHGDRVARGELVFWSTVGGVFAAANLCVVAQCSTDREYAAVYSGTIAGALALSLAASRHGVEQGEAQLYNSAQTWGSWNALGVNDGFSENSDEAAVSLVGQGAGVLAGIGLWQTWRPTAGDVALTNTFFLWGSVMTMWGHLAVDAEPSLRRIVVLGDASIVAGALLSTQVKMSRGRTLLIDVGGVLGMLFGSLIAVGASDNGDGSETTFGTSLFIGTGAGLGLAALFTKDWDAPKAPPVALAPTRIVQPGGQGVWGLSASFGF
jgi:hypothetical protein